MNNDRDIAGSPSLPFTGERFTPECVREIWYEHWHRYAFTLPLARGRRVLDAACGEGYGSALLASVAVAVTGVDVDAQTIAHAQRRYGGRENLHFRQASVVTSGFPDASFDLIVSFETIEHLAEQEKMLDEFRRVLAPDGLLVISSPDRERYNAGGEPNPHHVRELSRDELAELLSPRFPATRWYGQQLAFHSQLWDLNDQPGSAEVMRLDTDTGLMRRGPTQAPVYYVVLCAGAPGLLPSTPGLSLFADEQASVYNHYNVEIARLIRADHRIIALEQELKDLRANMASNPQSPDTQ